MKILQVPYVYYPDPVGGTEVYIQTLSRHLRELGITTAVAAPSTYDSVYAHEGIPVRRYRIDTPHTLRDLYGGAPATSLVFREVLDSERPDILHLHAFTELSLHLVRAARDRSIPVVFTYHTPTVTCQRGTMMRWGTQ